MIVIDLWNHNREWRCAKQIGFREIVPKTSAKSDKLCLPQKVGFLGESQKCNIFTTFLLKKCLFIYTYWHFGNAKKPYFRTKKALYIGICQFYVLLLSERP